MAHDRLRLFVATPVSGPADTFLQTIYRRRHELEQSWQLKSRVRWVRPENWHLTWTFLGEQPAERVEEIQKRLDTIVAKLSLFELTLSHLAFWPRPGMPNTFVWRALKQDAGFAEAEAIYQLIQKTLPGERHPVFKPHITLARMKPVKLKEHLKPPEDPTEVSWRVDTLSLYQSILKPDGPEYHALAEWELAGRPEDYSAG